MVREECGIHVHTNNLPGVKFEDKLIAGTKRRKNMDERACFGQDCLAKRGKSQLIAYALPKAAFNPKIVLNFSLYGGKHPKTSHLGFAFTRAEIYLPLASRCSYETRYDLFTTHTNTLPFPDRFRGTLARVRIREAQGLRDEDASRRHSRARDGGDSPPELSKEDGGVGRETIGEQRPSKATTSLNAAIISPK